MIKFPVIFRMLLGESTAKSNLIWIKWLHCFAYLEVQRKHTLQNEYNQGFRLYSASLGTALHFGLVSFSACFQQFGPHVRQCLENEWIVISGYFTWARPWVKSTDRCALSLPGMVGRSIPAVLSHWRRAGGKRIISDMHCFWLYLKFWCFCPSWIFAFIFI